MNGVEWLNNQLYLTMMGIAFQLGLTTGWIGLMFMVAPGVYGLVAPLCGWVSDKVSTVYAFLKKNQAKTDVI